MMNLPTTITVGSVLQEALASVQARPEVPGIIVRCRRTGEPDRVAAVGVGDRRTDSPRRVDEHVRIGSVTKLFTSTVALQLVAEGALDLDAELPALPDVPALSTPPGPPVTLRQLLNHTSGLTNYVLDADFLANAQGPTMLARRFDRYTPAELIAIAARHPRSWSPGARFEYGGTAYCLIGLHVERVTGATLADQLRDRITAPLGLDATFLPDHETGLPDPHSRGYSTLYVEGGPEHDLTELDASSLWAGGAMISRLDELLTSLGAVLDGRLLPKSLHDQRFATVSTDGANWIADTRYGLGIYAQRLPSGLEVWGHAGNIHGSWSAVMGTRDGHRLMAVQLNSDAVDPLVINQLLDAGLAD